MPKRKLKLIHDALEEEVKLELTWYFNQSESDCGMKSNWNAMVQAALLPGGCAWSDPYDTQRLKAIDLKRQVERILFSLSQQHQKCLWTIFGPQRIPIEVEKQLGELAGPSLCGKNHKEVIKACQRMQVGKASVQDKMMLSEIRIKATSLRSDAIREYRRKHREQQRD